MNLKAIAAYLPGNKDARILAQRMRIRPSHYRSRPEHADLHLHSWCADGFFSPTQLVTAAHFMGLKAVALTDNESFAGQQEMQAECSRLGITNIPGIELHIKGEHFIRLLGYYMSFTNPALLSRLNTINQARQVFVQKLLEQLKATGIIIDPLSVQEHFPAGLYCKQQVAEILARTRPEHSFKHWLGLFWRLSEHHMLDQAFLQITDLYFTLDEAIAMIHADGGIPIWANHRIPLIWMNDANRLISQKKWGLNGIMGFESAPHQHQNVLPIEIEQLINKLKDEAGITPLRTFGSNYHDGRREQFGMPNLSFEVGKAEEAVAKMQAAKQDKSIIVMR